MHNLTLALRQIKYTNKTYWRNPASVFFTFAFPLIFLVIFTVIFGGNNTTHISATQSVRVSTFYVPAIAVFAIISACYTNLAIGVAIDRDAGVLKRTHGTPLPTLAYLLARIVHAILIAILLVVIVTVAGALFYHASLPGASLAAFLLTLIVGSACFCSLGLAVSCIIPNAEAAPAVVNGIILPLLFISNVFIPLNNPPQWLNIFSKIFPVRHFSEAMLASFFPVAGHSAFRGTDLLVMLAWGVASLLLALRFFSWEPRK